MATRLGRLRDRVVAAFGQPLREHVDAVWCLDRRTLLGLPMDPERRQHVARLMRSAIWNGYRPGAGVPALRRALRRGVEFGDAEADVAPDLVELLDELGDVIEPTPFD